MVSTQTEQRSEEYNGWPNRETWAFMLWLQNDEGLYNDARDFIGSATVTDTMARNFGESMIDELYRSVESVGVDGNRGRQNGCSVAESALRDIGSTWRIDWMRVAEALNEWND